MVCIYCALVLLIFTSQISRFSNDVKVYLIFRGSHLFSVLNSFLVHMLEVKKRAGAVIITVASQQDGCWYEVSAEKNDTCNINFIHNFNASFVITSPEEIEKVLHQISVLYCPIAVFNK